MSYEADSDSDTFLDRSPSKVKRQGVKKRELVKGFKENTGKRLSLNRCFEYRLSRSHDNSAHRQKGEILDLLISLARVVSELRHIKKLTVLFLAWEQLYRRRRKRIKLIKFLEVLGQKRAIAFPCKIYNHVPGGRSFRLYRNINSNTKWLNNRMPLISCKFDKCEFSFKE